jgi:hypothetical protein
MATADIENPTPDQRQAEFPPTRQGHALYDDLGVDEAGAEVILYLRRQVIELQSHIRQLEAELTTHRANQTMRLARYREEYYEATWIELEFVDDEE